MSSPLARPCLQELAYWTRLLVASAEGAPTRLTFAAMQEEITAAAAVLEQESNFLDGSFSTGPMLATDTTSVPLTVWQDGGVANTTQTLVDTLSSLVAAGTCAALRVW